MHAHSIGRSEEGRDIVLLAIADEAGIQALEQLKQDTAALADPRTTDPAAAEQIVAGARPIYYFNAALHSDETGSTESVLELAYRLAVSEQPMIQRIRQNLVVLINPVSNPDGRDKVVEARRTAARCRACRRLTGRSTHSSTSIATRISWCMKPRAQCRACSSNGIPPSCTICTRASRC
jgi:hypothetical protein